jgi:hypothetical protein
MKHKWDRDLLQVAALASAASVFAFAFYFQRGHTLLYGDAVAHINIARRVLDSQTPGPLQLGTVWLPLPHLLMIPFLLSDWMWQNGAGGSIPSMIAYVLGATGIFRLVRGVLEADGRSRPAARSAGWLAAVVYAANPNLLYLQATAMTEPLYLALFIWAVAYFVEFIQRLRPGVQEENSAADPVPLFRCAGCLAGAELTRYDGWFLAAGMAAVVVILLLRRWHDRSFRGAALKSLLGIVAVPLLWLAYNAAVYGNPLEFANGPYSAQAIQQRTAAVNPAAKHVGVAASYFLKSAELNMADGNWGRIWIAVVLAGLVLIAIEMRGRGVLLLLGAPLVFYPLSIAYGGVPLYLPAWWPFTWYNLRYGLQLLPLFAVSAALVVSALSASSAREGASEKGRLAPSLKRWPDTNLHLLASGVAVFVVGVSYFFLWRAQPLCFKEAWVNSQTRLALESSVTHAITELPGNSRFLMYLGDHVGVFQQAGVPLRQVINEGNHRPWKKPTDREGLWERALADPPRYVDFVIAFDGDPVEQAVDRTQLTLLTEIHATGQPPARIYLARARLNQSR